MLLFSWNYTCPYWNHPQARGDMVPKRIKGRRLQPTLMKAGPAHSMLWTRNPYHHRVPLLSLSRSRCRLPIHIAGMARSTGTKMRARWRKRTPVQRGSQTYKSRKSTILWPTRGRPCSSSPICLDISAREASSMRSSPVLWEPSSSSPDSATKLAVVATAAL